MPQVERIGPASVALPFNGAALAGDRLAVVTRNVAPARIAIVDLPGWGLAATADIPTGTGAWGVTTSGGAVYLGQQQDAAGPNLFRYDLSRRRLEGVARLDTTLIWDLDTGLDGTVYGVGRGIAPFAYDPASGRARLLGGAPAGVNVLRSVAFVAGLVVVGGRKDGRALLVAINPATGRGRSLLPPELADDTIVYTLAAGRGREVVAGTEGPGGVRPAVARIALDEGGPTAVTRLDGEALVDALAVDGPRVYAMARRSGSLWRVEGAHARRVAAPAPHAEHRGLFVHRGALVGVSAAERVFRVDPRSGESEVVELADRGLEPRPERAQSLAARNGTVWVGGNFSLQRLDTTAGGRDRVFVPGEPKDLHVAGETVWFALYPAGEVWRRVGERRPERFAGLPAEHNRPVTLTADDRSGRLVVTAASDRLGGGSLSVLDPGDGATASLRQVFSDPRRAPAGLAVRDGVAFVGGGGNSPPLAAVALDGWRRLWETPVPGTQTMIGLAVHGDRVYGFTPDGWFVVLAAGNGRLLHREQLPRPGGRLLVQGGSIYGAGRESLVRFDPATYAWEIVRDGLAALYWNHAFLAGDGTRIYALEGLELFAVRP